MCEHYLIANDMKVSDLIVSALVEQEVKYIFGVAGEETLDLLDSLKDSQIEYVPTRHEQGAAYMAATVGRVTGQAGVVLATVGPGALNLVNGIAHAQLGGMPLVVITAQKQLKGGTEGDFQLVDVRSVYEPIVKRSFLINTESLIAETISGAFRLANAPRQGVVHIELPEDIAGNKVSQSSTEGLYTVEEGVGSSRLSPDIDEVSLSEAATAISSANKPLILIGGEANRVRYAKLLQRFVEALGIHFFSTPLGKGAIDERHQLYLGCGYIQSGTSLHGLISESDLIISIGYDPHEKPPFVADEVAARLLSISEYHIDWSSWKGADVELVGEPDITLERLMGSVEKRNYWKGTSLSEYQARTVKAERSDLAQESESLFGGSISDALHKDTPSEEMGIHSDENYEFDPYEAVNVAEKIDIVELVDSLRLASSHKSIVCLDNGLYKLKFAERYKAYSPQTVLLDNSLATMGAGLPSAIATKLVYPSAQVIAVIGDGGFMMSLGELETMVRLNLSIKIVLIDNGGFEMIRWKQRELALQEYGLSFGNPNWSRLAESFGISYRELRDPVTLQIDLAKAFRSRRAELIVCRESKL